MGIQVKLHETPFGTIEERGPSEILSDHATSFTLDHLKINPGDRVAEAGCGTGVLSMFSALAGASEVTGTDVDSFAIEAATANAFKMGLIQVRFLRGSLLTPISSPLDLVIALLPHKPAPRPFNPRFYGGPDGTDLIFEIIRQAGEKFSSGGRLVLYLNSIADPKQVLRKFSENFDVVKLGEKKRYFTKEEFDNLTPGMFSHLEQQKKAGKADFASDAGGLFFRARIFEGKRK